MDPLDIGCLACMWFCGWSCRRICRHGSSESLGWAEASQEDAEELLHYTRLNMGAYFPTVEEAVEHTDGAATVENVVKLVSHNSDGRCPGHILYLDHERRDVVICIRGLNMSHPEDWQQLTRNSWGEHPYDNGFVHHSMMQAAEFLLDMEVEVLKELLLKHPGYRLTIVGHSMGAGVAQLLAVNLVELPQLVGGIPIDRIKCWGIGAPRVLSLDLAVKYAHVLNTAILQDDFLPRINTRTVYYMFPFAAHSRGPLRYFCTCFCIPMCTACLRDSCITDRKMLSDSHRLYAAGRIYHIVYKVPCRCRKLDPPVCKTRIPVKGRFERAILSSSTFSDHSIGNYIRVLAEDMKVERWRGVVVEPPSEQKMDRVAQANKEFGRAVERVETLKQIRDGVIPGDVTELDRTDRTPLLQRV